MLTDCCSRLANLVEGVHQEFLKEQNFPRSVRANSSESMNHNASTAVDALIRMPVFLEKKSVFWNMKDVNKYT